MGILEYRGVHLHPLCRDPQEPGSSHIQGQIRQPRPVDAGTDSGKGWDNTVRGVFICSWGFINLELNQASIAQKMWEVEEGEEFQLGGNSSLFQAQQAAEGKAQRSCKSLLNYQFLLPGAAAHLSSSFPGISRGILDC